MFHLYIKIFITIINNVNLRELLIVVDITTRFQHSGIGFGKYFKSSINHCYINLFSLGEILISMWCQSSNWKLQNENSFPFADLLIWYLDAISSEDVFKKFTPDNSKAAFSSIHNRLKIILPPFKGVSQASSDGSIRTIRFCMIFAKSILVI